MFAYTVDCWFTNARDGQKATIWADKGIWVDAYGNKRAIDGDTPSFLKQVGAYSPLYYAVQDGRVVALSSSQLDSVNALIALKADYEDYVAVLTEGKVLWIRAWAHKEEPNVASDIERNYPPYECPWSSARDSIARTTELPGGWYARSWIGTTVAGDNHHYAVLSNRAALVNLCIASEFHPERQYLMAVAGYLHDNAEELFRQVFHGGDNDITF